MMKRLVYLLMITLFLAAAFNCKKGDRVVPRQGLVNFTTGDVSIVNTDGQKSLAKVGDTLAQGMKIITVGSKSMADIYFGKNAIKILGDTTVEIKQLITNITKDTQGTELFVSNGGVFSRVKKLSKDDSYLVKTQTTTAGVRGTEFLVEQRGNRARVACIEGKIECRNDTQPKAQPVILEDNEEVSIEEGQDMVKQQIGSDRTKMLNIIRNIQEMREDIRKKYEQQKAEIKKYVTDQRQRNREMVQQQREGDAKRVADQKARDKQNIEDIKGTSQKAAADSTDAAKSVMKESTGAASKEKATDGAKSQIDKLRQGINKDQFKQ